MKLITLTTFWKDFASQNLPFFYPFSIFFMFFRNPSGRALLAPKVPVYAKNHDFGSPFGFPWPQKSAPGPFSDGPHSVSGRVVPSLVAFPCAAPHFAPHPSSSLGYLQLPAMAVARKGGFSELRKLKMGSPLRCKIRSFFKFFCKRPKS